MARFFCYFLCITANEIARGAKQFLCKSNTSIDNKYRHNKAIYNAKSNISDNETSRNNAESNRDSNDRSSLHAFTYTQRDIDYIKDARELFRLNRRQRMCAVHLWDVLSKFKFVTTNYKLFDSGLYYILAVLDISNNIGHPHL
jgi:hypothetical protein